MDIDLHGECSFLTGLCPFSGHDQLSFRSELRNWT